MISTTNLSLQYGKRVLFDEVNIKFNDFISNLNTIYDNKERLNILNID